MRKPYRSTSNRPKSTTHRHHEPWCGSWFGRSCDCDDDDGRRRRPPRPAPQSSGGDAAAKVDPEEVV